MAVDAGAEDGVVPWLGTEPLPGAEGGARFGRVSGSRTAGLAGGSDIEAIGSCRTVSAAPFPFVMD